MKVIKFILSILLSFVLMVGIIGTTVTIFGSKILEKEYILSTFDDVDLYNQVLKEVESDFEQYIYQSGLDKDLILKLCTREKVETDIRAVIDCLYSGEEFNVDTTEMKAVLDQMVEQEVNSQKRKISVEEQKNIDKFKNTILKSYQKSIGIYANTTEFVQGDLPKATEVVNKIKDISIAVTVVSAVMLILINIKNFFACLNCVSISLISSGTILILVKKLVYSKIDVDNLLILANSLSSAVIHIINNFLNSIATTGSWLILFGLIGILIISIKNMNRDEEKNNKKK